MSAMKWMKWVCGGLLAAGAALATGCGGGDEEPALTTTTTVVTNTVGGVTTVTTNTVVVPNAPPEDPADPATEDPDVPVISTLFAPQLVSPEDGVVLDTSQTRVKIRFEWTAVRGADAYVLELDGVQHSSALTTMTLSVARDTQPHTWRVRPKKTRTGEIGPPSETFTFWFAF